MDSYRTLGGGSIDGYFGKNPDWSKIKVKTGRTIWSSYDDNTLQAWLVEDTNAGGVLLAGGNYANPIQIAGNELPEIAGYFVDGFEFKNPNQVGIDASGNSWRYVGNSPLPYTVTAGTDPNASSDYEKVFESTLQNLNGLEQPSDLDKVILRTRTSAQAIAEDAPVGTRYLINQGRYEVVESSDAGGFYIEGLASGRKIRYEPKNAIAVMSHTSANDTTDSSEILPALAAAGFKKINVDIDVLCSTGDYTIPESELTIFGNGKFLVDWASIGYGVSGDEKWVYNFSGEKVIYKHVGSESLTGKVEPFVEQEFTSFLRFTGDKSKVRHTRGDYHPNYVFSVLDASKRFDFISNEGEGQLVDGSAQTGTHCLLFQRDGLKGIHSHNEGENWCNVILHGLSPQKTTVNYNKGFDCGNHVFYGSSTDYCHAQGNEAYGENTDFKLRGDGNVCIGNIVEGGSFSMTNRVADTGNGYGLNKATSLNNVVTCNRDAAIAYSIRNRTGFDSPAGEIISSNNTVRSENTSPNAHIIIFSTIDSVSCSDKVTCDGDVTDGIRISPTDGITPASVGRITISDSYSIGATDQAYQLTASDVVMNGFNASSGGGSGSSGGAIAIRCGYANISAFSAKVSNNIYVLNFPTLIEANIDVGKLERPAGGTLPHVFNGSGTLNEGLLITKIN